MLLKNIENKGYLEAFSPIIYNFEIIAFVRACYMVIYKNKFVYTIFFVNLPTSLSWNRKLVLKILYGYITSYNSYYSFYD